MKRLSFAVLLMMGTVAGVAYASPERDAILNTYAVEAKAGDAGFAGFAADRGKQLFQSEHKGESPDVTSCTSCHSADPTKSGKTRAGKTIEPMAVSATPSRFTDAAKVEKWFGRNCKSVLGRACTPVEKGDFITYLSGI